MPVTNCTQESFQFPVLKRRIVEANFQGGDITSDGGVLLLQPVDHRLGLSEAVTRTLDDPRRQASCDHDSLSLLRQRIYALALGYEDLNDHQTLRLDLAIQTALGRREELASSSTLCRWENRADRETAVRMYEVIVGIAKNQRLNALTAQLQRDTRDCFAKLGTKVRWFTDIRYAAGSWNRSRRVIAKIEHSGKGSNPRYVVTNLKGDGKALYDRLYCARGEMENRIKEQQLDLFADRTSCHRWWPNQFRLLLSSLAYMLLEAIRRLTLKGTELANAYVGTLRLKLLKIGAVILRNTRRIRFLLSSACPYRRLFLHVAARLAPE